MRDHYQILGIPYSADENQIKKAYRQLVKQFHPDKNGDEQAVSIFQEMQTAYETLSNPKEKAKYDMTLYLDKPDLSGRRNIKNALQLVAITDQLVGEIKRVPIQQLDQNNLYHYMRWLLEKDAALMLLENEDSHLQEDFITNTIFISSKLSNIFQIEILESIQQIANYLKLEQFNEAIQTPLQAALSIERQRKRTPIWIVLSAVCVLFIVYFLAQ